MFALNIRKHTYIYINLSHLNAALSSRIHLTFDKRLMDLNNF
jgi:hypothetical protein